MLKHMGQYWGKASEDIEENNLFYLWMSSLGHRKQDNLNSLSNIIIPNGIDKAFSQTPLPPPPFSPTSQVASTQPYTLTIYARIPKHNTKLFQNREREIINQQQFLSHLNPSHMDPKKKKKNPTLMYPHKKSHP